MLVEVSECVRVESSPPRKRAKATEKLLDGKVTASHYKIGGVDARGNTIELGKMMDYIDWFAAEDDHVWIVYKMDDEGRFQPVSAYATRDEAEQAAQAV